MPRPLQRERERHGNTGQAPRAHWRLNAEPCASKARDGHAVFEFDGPARMGHIPDVFLLEDVETQLVVRGNLIHPALGCHGFPSARIEGDPIIRPRHNHGCVVLDASNHSPEFVGKIMDGSGSFCFEWIGHILLTLKALESVGYAPPEGRKSLACRRLKPLARVNWTQLATPHLKPERAGRSRDDGGPCLCDQSIESRPEKSSVCPSHKTRQVSVSQVAIATGPSLRSPIAVPSPLIHAP